MRCSWRAIAPSSRPSDRTSIEQLLEVQGRHADRRVPGAGPPDAAIRQQARPAEGARPHRRSAAQPVHHRAVAGLARTGMDAQARLESAEARPRPARRRVPRVPGGRAGRGEAAARSPRAGLSRLAAQRAGPLSGRAGGLPGEPRARAVSRCRQLRQGQGGDSRGQPQSASDRYHGRTARRPWN